MIPSLVTYPACLAGLPAHKVKAGISLVTTAPAPTNALSPITIPHNKTAPAPIEAFFLIKVRPSLNGCFALGYLSLVNVTLGPI